MFQALKRLTALVCAALLLVSFPSAQAKEAEPLNILLVGVDQSAPGTRGRSDTMMLARVEPSTGSIRLVSFLRDLYVPIPGLGKTRLNAACQQGGEALLKDTLAQNFDLSIDHTVTVNFSMLSDLVSLAPMLTAGEGLSLEFAHVPFEGAYQEETIRGMMVLVPDLSACRGKLRRFLDGK